MLISFSAATIAFLASLLDRIMDNLQNASLRELILALKAMRNQF